MKKRLYKDKSSKLLGGVLSGLSQYFNINVDILRVLFLLLTFFAPFFPGYIIYFILVFILPDKTDLGYSDYKVE